MNTTAETTIRRSDDVLAANYLGEPHDAVGNQLRMLQHVRCVANHAGNNNFTVGQLGGLPHLPLMLVAHVACLYRIALSFYFEQQVDHILEFDVAFVWAVPTAPTHVES